MNQLTRPSASKMALQIFALCGFAIAQPVFSVLSSTPSMFLARRSEAPELILFAAILVFVPPAILIAIVWIAGRFDTRLGEWVGIAIIWVLLGLFALQVMADVTQPLWILSVLFSASVASAATLAYLTYVPVQQFFSILAVAPIIFLGMFLFTGPASDFVMPAGPVGTVEVDTTTDDSAIFIVLDEFPASAILDANGSIDVERFPNLADIASDSYWFPFTVAPHPYTTRSASGIVTGNYSVDNASASSADYPMNIMTLMGATHEMHVVEPSTEFCPDSVCNVPETNRWTLFEVKGLLRTALEIHKRATLPQLFDDTVLTLDDPFGVFGGNQVRAAPSRGTFSERVNTEIRSDQIASWDAWLMTLTARNRQFHYRHVFLPHAPYRYLPDGTQTNTISQSIPAMVDGWWTGDPWHTVDAHQRQLLQIQAADMLVGRLKRRLIELGTYDETMIVITSDHGASHVPETQRRTLSAENLGHLAFVPLIMKAPHQQDGIVWDSPVSGLDILPTMAAMMGTGVPWETEGRSVLDQPRQSAAMQSQTGELVVAEPEKLLEAVEFVNRRFPKVDDGFDIYSYAGYEEILGKAVSELEIGNSTSISSLDEPELYEDIDPSIGVIPAFVSGTIDSLENPEGALIAIVVNDVVASVVPVHDIAGSEAAFGGVVPARYFRAGTNSIRVIVVRGDEQDPILMESTLNHDSG